MHTLTHDLPWKTNIRKTSQIYLCTLEQGKPSLQAHYNGVSQAFLKA